MTITNKLTWQYAVNISLPASNAVDECRGLWWRWKKELTSFASAPWTVAGSSDGSTAGMDGTDRWTSAGILPVVASTGNRGWIVLQCPTTGAQVLVSLVVFNTSWCGSIRLRVSPGGLFTGGAIDAEPTATDQITIRDGGDYQMWGKVWGSVAIAYRLHIWRSTGGEATMWAVSHDRNGTLSPMCTAFGYMGRLDQSRYNSSFGAMMFASVHKVEDNVLTTPNVLDQHLGTENTATSSGNIHSAYFANLPGGTNARMYLTAPMYNPTNSYNPSAMNRFTTGMTHGTIVSPANELTGEYDFPQIGCHCTTERFRGTHGYLYDLRWGNDDLPSVATFPGDGTKTRIRFGPFTAPWNGTIPVL